MSMVRVHPDRPAGSAGKDLWKLNRRKIWVENEQKRTNNLKDNLVFPNEKGNAQKCAYNFTERWKTNSKQVQKANKSLFMRKRVNNPERKVQKKLRQFKENHSIVRNIIQEVQANKSVRWMPWHQEPMKDVTSCDKPRGAANKHYIRGFPNEGTPMMKNHGALTEFIG